MGFSSVINLYHVNLHGASTSIDVHGDLTIRHGHSHGLLGISSIELHINLRITLLRVTTGGNVASVGDTSSSGVGLLVVLEFLLGDQVSLLLLLFLPDAETDGTEDNEGEDDGSDV